MRCRILSPSFTVKDAEKFGYSFQTENVNLAFSVQSIPRTIRVLLRITVLLVIVVLVYLALTHRPSAVPFGIQVLVAVSTSLSVLFVANRSSYIFSARAHDLSAAQAIIIFQTSQYSAKEHGKIAGNYLGAAQEFRYNALFLTHSAVFFIFATFALLISVFFSDIAMYVLVAVATILWMLGALSQVIRYIMYDVYKLTLQGASTKTWNWMSGYTNVSQWLSQQAFWLTFVKLSRPSTPSSEVMGLIKDDEKSLKLWQDLEYTQLLLKLRL